MNTGQGDSIPLLDLERFDAGDAQRGAFLSELRNAARHVGFFHLVGHGIELELRDATTPI